MTEERLRAISSVRREINRTRCRIAEIERQTKKAGGNLIYEAALSAEKAALENYIVASKREETALIDYINSIDDMEVREQKQQLQNNLDTIMNLWRAL